MNLRPRKANLAVLLSLVAPLALAQDLIHLLRETPLEAQDDRVMGGISQSEPQSQDGAWIFTGRLSRDQGGGFASIQAHSHALGKTLARTQGVVLRVRGDGRIYQLRFRQLGEGDWLSYRAKFQAPQGRTQEVILPWGSFEASFRGRVQPGAPALRPRDIHRIGLLTSDGPEGRFFLRVEELRTWISGTIPSNASAGSRSRPILKIKSSGKNKDR